MPLNDLMVALFKEWGSGNRDLKANWARAREWLLERTQKRDGKRAHASLDALLPKSLNFDDLGRTFCSQMKNAGVSLEVAPRSSVTRTSRCEAGLRPYGDGHAARSGRQVARGATAVRCLATHQGPSRRQRQRLARALGAAATSWFRIRGWIRSWIQIRHAKRCKAILVAPDDRHSTLLSAEKRAFAVGATGFEPATSCSQSMRSTRLCYTPRSRM